MDLKFFGLFFILFFVFVGAFYYFWYVLRPKLKSQKLSYTDSEVDGIGIPLPQNSLIDLEVQQSMKVPELKPVEPKVENIVVPFDEDDLQDLLRKEQQLLDQLDKIQAQKDGWIKYSEGVIRTLKQRR